MFDDTSKMRNTEIQRLWERLDCEERGLKEEKSTLRKIWLKISKMHKTNADNLQQFTTESSELLKFLPSDTQISLNVSGQIFNTTVEILTKDKFSILANLCTTNPSLPPSNDPESDTDTPTFFIERDWWIFRYVLHFMMRHSSLTIYLMR